MIQIVAANFREYMAFVAREKLGAKFSFVHNEADLRGVHGTFMLLHGYSRHQDWVRIEPELRALAQLPDCSVVYLGEDDNTYPWPFSYGIRKPTKITPGWLLEDVPLTPPVFGPSQLRSVLSALMRQDIAKRFALANKVLFGSKTYSDVRESKMPKKYTTLGHGRVRFLNGGKHLVLVRGKSNKAMKFLKMDEIFDQEVVLLARSGRDA